MYKVVHFLTVCLYFDSEKVYSIFFGKKITPVHLDNFVNFTSVLGYFILNSRIRIAFVL